jgi:putative acetyltransferase
MEADMATTIETYKPEYESDFVRLNKEWIEHYFSIEPADAGAFEQTKHYIIDNGGQIFFAVEDGDVVGCVALVFHPDTHRWELAKMAVTSSQRGKGTGSKLGTALISYARKHRISRIYLEGNTNLKPSIALYKKLGFKEIELRGKHYERVNVAMEWSETN